MNNKSRFVKFLCWMPIVGIFAEFIGDDNYLSGDRHFIYWFSAAYHASCITFLVLYVML